MTNTCDGWDRLGNSAVEAWNVVLFVFHFNVYIVLAFAARAEGHRGFSSRLYCCWAGQLARLSYMQVAEHNNEEQLASIAELLEMEMAILSARPGTSVADNLTSLTAGMATLGARQQAAEQKFVDQCHATQLIVSTQVVTGDSKVFQYVLSDS